MAQIPNLIVNFWTLYLRRLSMKLEKLLVFTRYRSKITILDRIYLSQIRMRSYSTLTDAVREREWKREAGRESGLGLSAGTRACAEVPTKIECGGWSVLEAASAREQVRNSTDFPPFSRLCGRARECVGIEMRGDAGNQ